jgi:hypothetical protein
MAFFRTAIGRSITNAPLAYETRQILKEKLSRESVGIGPSPKAIARRNRFPPQCPVVGRNPQERGMENEE